MCTKFGLSIAVSLKLPFEVAEEAQTLALEFFDPALVDLVNRNGIDEVKLRPSASDSAHQISALQQIEVLGRRLPDHVQLLAELTQPRAQKVDG
jgi:hypothetical protein